MTDFFSAIRLARSSIDLITSLSLISLLFVFFKVQLAAQTLSRSTSIALKTLRKLGIPGFHDTKPTEKFLLLVDELFDRLNCQFTSGRGTKSPLTLQNLSHLKDLLQVAQREMLPMCNVHGCIISKTKRHVGINGIICAAKSLIEIGNELLNEAYFSFILSYRMSQDNLELLFCAIRQAGTHNKKKLQLLKKLIHKLFL
jgi:hypothetical protein